MELPSFQKIQTEISNTRVFLNSTGRQIVLNPPTDYGQGVVSDNGTLEFVNEFILEFNGYREKYDYQIYLNNLRENFFTDFENSLLQISKSESLRIIEKYKRKINDLTKLFEVTNNHVSKQNVKIDYSDFNLYNKGSDTKGDVYSYYQIQVKFLVECEEFLDKFKNNFDGNIEEQKIVSNITWLKDPNDLYVLVWALYRSKCINNIKGNLTHKDAFVIFGNFFNENLNNYADQIRNLNAKEDPDAPFRFLDFLKSTYEEEYRKKYL